MVHSEAKLVSIFAFSNTRASVGNGFAGILAVSLFLPRPASNTRPSYGWQVSFNKPHARYYLFSSRCRDCCEGRAMS